jgi:hypothetical protein
MVLSIYSCFIVPIQFSFDPDFAYSTYFIVIDSFVNLIFVTDMIIIFRTTFIHPKTGKEVSNLWAIALNYFRFRFWADLLACMPFDSLNAFINNNLLQLFSLLRLARVLRLGKIISAMKIKDEIKLSLKLLKLIFFLMVYVHCVGCIWYYIVINVGNESWLPPLDFIYLSTDFYERELSYRYCMSLFYAVIIFKGKDVGPKGTFQVAFVTVFAMIGAIITAHIFGELAVILSAMNRKFSLFKEKYDIITTSMRNLCLPEKLQNKITGFLTYTQSNLESQNQLKAFLETVSPSLS